MVQVRGGLVGLKSVLYCMHCKYGCNAANRPRALRLVTDDEAWRREILWHVSCLRPLFPSLCSLCFWWATQAREEHDVSPQEIPEEDRQTRKQNT